VQEEWDIKGIVYKSKCTVPCGERSYGGIIVTEQEIHREIIKAHHEREKKILSQFATKSRDGIRLIPYREKMPDMENVRPAFFHDTDKIIHSKAYTRYIDKTQVFSLFENDHITHRVLHVQFVSKVARVIGRCLGLNEDLIEAVALGHDIGHTPYGHDGERYLNQLCIQVGIGYFCHNAQSVRFLHEIEADGKGLNLTLQVLDGILAHNGEIINERLVPDTKKDWDQFLQEYKSCFQVKDISKKIYPMTLEGCVVRVADFIAYLGRDIEDAITIGLISRAQIPSSIVEVLGDSNDQIINALAMDVINNSYGQTYIAFSPRIYQALLELKEFNRKNIYANPRIKTQDKKIRRMFEMLFFEYLEDIKQGDKASPIFSYYLDYMGHKYLGDYPVERLVIDFIAGMTDDFFNNQFRKTFVPQSYGSKLI